MTLTREQERRIDIEKGEGAYKPTEPSRREQCFPGTGRMFSDHHQMAVSSDWLAGWDACIAEIDKRRGFSS